MRKDSTTFRLGMAFGCLIAFLAGVNWLGISRHFPLSQGLVIGLALCIAVFTTRRLKREMAGRERAPEAIHGLNENLEKKEAGRTEELRRSAEELKVEMTERLATAKDGVIAAGRQKGRSAGITPPKKTGRGSRSPRTRPLPQPETNSMKNC